MKLIGRWESAFSNSWDPPSANSGTLLEIASQVARVDTAPRISLDSIEEAFGWTPFSKNKSPEPEDRAYAGVSHEPGELERQSELRHAAKDKMRTKKK